MGCGGQMPHPADYLKRAYDIVRAAGGVCVADEVQTGFGRVGSHFWSFELSGVIPDIVAMGKPIANGYPLGAVVTTPAIAAAFNNGMEYFNTFGGNPVACAIGLEVLNIIKDENLQQHAFDTGKHWMQGLQKLQAQHPIIGQVRGSGLFLGVELIRDAKTLEPADWEATYHRRAHERARHPAQHRRTASQRAQAQAADGLCARGRGSFHVCLRGRSAGYAIMQGVGGKCWQSCFVMIRYSDREYGLMS